MRRLMIMIVAAMLGTVSAAHADAPAGYPFVRYDEGLREAAAQNKKIFLYYGRYGCGFCDKTNKESFTDAEVKRLYTKNYVLVYVDAESGRRLMLPSGERVTEMEVGARLKAKVTPVFMFLEPDGKPIASVPGFQTARDFLAFDQYVQGGHYKTQALTDYLTKTKTR
jgi:thioredoxin-related protein